MSARITVVSGAGRFADPWHPFAETSARIAAILEEAGHDVRVSDEVDARLAELAERHAPRTDLLVINIGDPVGRDESGAIIGPITDPTADAASRNGLLAYLAAGRPVLAFHVSSTSLDYVPEWEPALGGIWVRGTTMHPPYSRAHIEVATDAHPIVAGVGDFDVDDERYSFMRVSPAVTELAWHEHEGRRHPLLWAHRYGDARVVYDALGHDAASYDAPEHRAIVAQAAEWLLG